jgi:hypothetical protein
MFDRRTTIGIPARPLVPALCVTLGLRPLPSTFCNPFLIRVHLWQNMFRLSRLLQSGRARIQSSGGMMIDAERRYVRSHAERGNEIRRYRRNRQSVWPL